MSSMMICPSCAAELPAGSRFCEQCGMALASVAPTAAGGPGASPAAAMAPPVKVPFPAQLVTPTATGYAQLAAEAGGYAGIGAVPLMKVERVIYDVETGLLQRGLNLAVKRNLLLTTHRVLLIDKQHLAGEQIAYAVDLKSISAIALQRHVPLLATVLTAIFFALLLPIGVSAALLANNEQAISSHVLAALACWVVGAGVSFLVWLFGSRVSIEFSVSSFTGTRLSGDRYFWLVVVMMIVCPPLALLIYLLGSRVKAVSRQGLYFEIRRQLNCTQLHELASEFWRMRCEGAHTS